MKPSHPDDRSERNPTAALPDIDEVIRTQRAFVARVLLRAGVAERDLPDVEQEVFLVVHRRLSEFEGRSSLRTWLCRIALNLASDYRRRAYNRRESLHEVAGDSGADAACPIERLDTLTCVATALERLSVEKREAFLLHEIEELSMHDVARRTRVPLKTAFSRLYCARRELRALLLREGIALAAIPAWWPRRFWPGRLQGWQMTQTTWLPSLAVIVACAGLMSPAPHAGIAPAAAPSQPVAAAHPHAAQRTAASAAVPEPSSPRPQAAQAQRKPQPAPKRLLRVEPRAAELPTPSVSRELLAVYRMSAQDFGPPVELPYGFEWVDDGPPP